jgi:hypothetical protein
MRFVLVLAMVAACEKGSQKKVSDITADEAKAFATQIGSAAYPCDVDKVAELVDADAMTDKLEKSMHSQASKLAGATFRDPHSAARILCGWNNGIEGYRMLHVRAEDGEQRIVMRRLARASRKPVVIVGYDELQLTRSADHKIRIGDVYSYTQGDWLSSLLAGGIDAMSEEGTSGGLDATHTLRQSRELQKDGKYTEALAALDSLPPNVHNSRMVQMARVRVADQISQDEYKQALDELEHLFPDDPSVALIEVDGAFLRNDFDAALKNIDILDKSIGGDPFQDAIRAEVYLKRNQPGDLDRAAAAAESAIKTEPTLAKGWWARLDTAVHLKQYPLAIETIEYLQKNFGATLTDEALHELPEYADFVASPEYLAWRSRGG